jgi:hypothetical protein
MRLRHRHGDGAIDALDPMVGLPTAAARRPPVAATLGNLTGCALEAVAMA